MLLASEQMLSSIREITLHTHGQRQSKCDMNRALWPTCAESMAHNTDVDSAACSHCIHAPTGVSWTQFFHKTLPAPLKTWFSA